MAINLRDYSKTAGQRGWGAGWPSCAGAKAAGTVIVTADLSGTRMSVHARIARLVDLLIDTTERRGYRLRSGQCGGYNCRAIGGTSSPSNHSWALAVDLNWQTNPMKRPLTTDMPAWMPQLWNRYGFAWGGHYSGTQDSMHYEFMGSPADADAMTALAIRELAATPPPQEDQLSAAFEKDARARWGREDTLEKDLRGDLARKQKQIDQLVAGQVRAEKALAQIVALLSAGPRQ